MTITPEENNERDVAKSPSELITIDILTIRKEIIELIEKNKLYNGGLNNQIKNKIVSLHYYIRSGLKRDNKTKNEEIETNFKEKDIEKYIESFLTIDEWLDTKRIIRIDNIKHYDRSSAEKENRQRGYGWKIKNVLNAILILEIIVDYINAHIVNQKKDTQ